MIFMIYDFVLKNVNVGYIDTKIVLNVASVYSACACVVCIIAINVYFVLRLSEKHYFSIENSTRPLWY